MPTKFSRPRFARSSSNCRRRSEDGVSAVEFALVFPFLILILFGMVTTGFAFADHLSTTNAVREGSRFGSGIDYRTATWATSVRDRVKQVYYNAGNRVTNAQICVKIVDSGGTASPTGANSWLGADCGGEPAAPTGMVSGSCAIKVWVRKPSGIQLVVAPDLNFNIGAEAVAYYGRSVGSCTAA